jgi:hypothetical protein
MWEPGRLTALWDFTACYWDSFTILPFLNVGSRNPDITFWDTLYVPRKWETEEEWFQQIPSAPMHMLVLMPKDFSTLYF